MSYKVIGEIQSISTIETNEYGSKLTCVVKNDETYNNLYILEYFNKDVSYLEKFLQYNKVGDQVEVEFNVSCRQGESKATGKPYAITKLSLWKCTKINGSSQSVDAQVGDIQDDSGDLPF